MPATSPIAVLTACMVWVAGRMRQLYSRAMQLEVDFFSAQPFQPPAPLPVALVVSDFDDTMLVGETNAAIVQTAAKAQSRGQAPHIGVVMVCCSVACVAGRLCHAVWSSEGDGKVVGILG